MAPSESILKIKQRIPRRLAEVALTRANTAYKAWIASGDARAILNMGVAIGGLPPRERDSYPARLIRAAHAFLDGRRTLEARKLLYKCVRERNPAWRYSLAFLEAYDGRLDRVRKLYAKIVSMPSPPAMVMDVEQFALRVIELEPDRVALLFLLGLINWRAKGDLVVASEYFLEFNSRAKGATFADDVRLADQYLAQMRAEQVLGRSGSS